MAIDCILPGRSGDSGLPHRDGGVSEAGHVHRTASGYETPGLDHVAGPVHGEHADQAAGRQPARRPGRFGRVAAPARMLSAAPW